MEAAFYQSESDQPHPGRARAIIKAHPKVRQLMVRNPSTALLAVSIVFLAGSAAVGVFIARMSDVEFAGFSGDRSTKLPAGTSAG